MNNLSKLLSFSTLSTFCAFALQLISANILSPHDYGVIGRWLTDLSFLSIFLVFGLDNSLLYNSITGNKAFNQNFSKNISFFSLISASLILLTYVSENQHYYLTLIITCYLLAIIQSLNTYNLLNSNFTKYGLTNLIRSSLLLLAFIVIGLLKIEISSNSYIAVYTLTIFSALLLILIISYKPRFETPKHDFSKNKLYLTYGFKSMSNTLFAVMLYSSTVYILDFFESKESVAIFFASMVLSKLAWVIPDSIGNLLYPKFLKIGIEFSEDQVLSDTYFYAQLNSLINIIAIVGFLVFGEFFISLVYGHEYQQMFWIVVILLIGNQGMVFYKILGRYHAAVNKWRTQRWALIIATLSNIAFNFILIKSFGILGSAIATAISFWVCGIIMAYSVKGSFIKFLDINSAIRKFINAK